MGLGVFVAAEAGAGSSRRARDGILADVAVAASAFASRQPAPLGDWSSSSTVQGALHVSLVPCEEDVVFRLEGDRLSCSARTSGAGPGYHAHVVDLLDELRARLGLEWRGEEPESADDDGYLGRRSFPRLQAGMAVWLRGLGRYLLEGGRPASGLVLGLPDGFRPTTTAFAVSATGEWSRPWFERLVAAGEEELPGLAAALFPWWERGVTARTLRGLALARSWVDVRWTVPADDDERRLYASVLACFDRARALDRELPLPEAEIGELRMLLAPGAPGGAPREAGIGFLRRSVRRPLPGGWSLSLPGYYESELERDGGTQVYRFGRRTVRGSSARWDPKVPRSPAEVLAGVSGEGGVALLLRPRGLAGKMSCSPSPDGEGFSLRAWVAKRDGLCLVTLSSSDEADVAWAQEVAVTIDAR